jgi:cell division protein FtsQ
VRAAAATFRLLPRAASVLPRPRPMSPHWRRRLLALALLLAALGAGYLFWLRDSSLVKVERVTVTGLDTPDAAAVRAKLTEAARRMTTLHVDEAALRDAVADEPVVQSLRVQADFPHALRIEIVENRPVAMLVAGGRELAVAPDGTVLEGAKAAGGLPSVRVGALPANGRLSSGQARQLVAVAAAAPVRLLPRISSISMQSGRGAVAQLQHGPVVVFGHADQLQAKWTAAAGVLARRESQGASYIDVRMPGRPVAGGLALQQEPQPGAEAPAAGASAGSPGIVSAEPQATAADPAQPQQAAPSTGATAAAPPATTAPAPATTAPPATATNPQP